MKTEDTYTIESLISAGKGIIISYSNFAILENIGGIYLPTNNVLYTYLEDIKKMAVTVTLSPMELHRYKYKPKLLSYDVYGVTDLYFVIMALNGIIDVKDFEKDKIKMLKTEDMNQLMSIIYNAEKKYIDKNRDDLGI